MVSTGKAAPEDGMKREGINVCAIALIALSLMSVVFPFLVSIGNVGFGGERYLTHLLSAALFMFSGIALFSFKEWARKLAIVSYAIVLLLAMLDYLSVFRGGALDKSLSGFTFWGPFFLSDLRIDFLSSLFDGWSLARLGGNLLLIALYDGLAVPRLGAAPLFMALLLLSKEQFQGDEGAESKIPYIKIGIAGIIIVFWGFFYFSAMKVLYAELKKEAENNQVIEFALPNIKKDPRFAKVELSVFRGGILAEGIVSNEKDREALGEILPKYSISYQAAARVDIDCPDAIAFARPTLLVNIGALEKASRAQGEALLRKKGLVYDLKTAKLLPNTCYVFVAPARREEAMALLKQDPALVGKYSPKMDTPSSIMSGGETLINIGFINARLMSSAAKLLANSGIHYSNEEIRYLGYDVSHIYVPSAERKRAVDLLRRDLRTREEFCSRE